MKIPLTDSFLSGNEFNNIKKCFEENWLTRGRFVDEFEKKFCRFLGVRYGFANCNGTTAITLALAGAGISSGKVIVPNYTCVACPFAVRQAGAEPLFIDIEPDTFGLDYGKVKRALDDNDDIKAILLVHLYGMPAKDTLSLLSLAKKYNIPLIEDCAEAHGAKIGAKSVGGFGVAGTFSFRGDKMIGVGEGGMTVTNDRKVYERVKKLGDLGRPDPKRRYYHDEFAWQFNLSNVAGAIGSAQVDILPEVIEKKQKLFKLYKEQLKEIEEQGLLRFQKKPSGFIPVYWLIGIVFAGIEKFEVIRYLNHKSIGVRPFFEPMTSLPMYRYQRRAGKYKISEEIARHGVLLPSSPLLTDKDVNKVCDAIKTIIKRSQK